MTPAIGTPALPPAAMPASGRGPAAAPDGGGGSNAFAKALQRRQTVDAAQAGPKSASVETPAASDPALDAAAAAGAAAPVVATAEPAEPALVDVQQALPGWPPAGLAGLLGFADDAAPLETPPAPTPVPVPVSISVPGPVPSPGQPPAG
ncbi:hypothetical protein H0E82_16635, partial [Luteimonas sp. SJ-16]|nr:hypothetical protein [Luteimonas deserti]